MGELFLAQQQGIAGFAKQLVVKRIKPDLVGDPKFVEMFLAEGRIAALIDHPNVVQIHELGKVEGQYFIAMEYVEGLSLARVMELAGGPLDLATALHVTSSLCEGLAYAHDAVGLDGQPLGLVHRDVSPPNILLGYSGCVKLSDFGIAKVLHHQQTGAGTLKGKFAYLSPEQARGERVDRRSDLYALGLVLFEMTVGARANPGETDSGMVFAAAKRDLPDPAELVPGYPPALRSIFLKATALELAERYQDARELAAKLLAFQLDQRIVLSAGTVGERIRTFAGPDATREEPAPSGADATGPIEAATGPGARPRIAYDPTVHAAGTPVSFEVDLEKELESPTTGERATGPRRSGRGLPIVAGVILLGVLGGGYLLLRANRGEPDAPVSASQGARSLDAGVARDHRSSDSPRQRPARGTPARQGHPDGGASRSAIIRASMLHDSRPPAAPDAARSTSPATDAGPPRALDPAPR
jgi:serine/threonine-protein kinase